MYLGQQNLGGANSGMMPGRGLVNPSFIIKIVPANDDMEQERSTGRNNPNNDVLSNIKVGNKVSTTIKGKDITGTIERIIKNGEGDVIKIVMIDKDGELHNVGVTDIKIGDIIAPNDADVATSSPAMFAESKFLSFSEFIKL